MARWTLVFLVACLACSTLWAKEAVLAAQNPVLEAKMMQIAKELRCLVCQNQTIAESHAALAIDLRQQVREQLESGKSEEQIYAYMTARYGDFVLYRPPLKTSTYLLWLGPAVFMVLGILALLLVLHRRSKLPDDAFEADVLDPTHTPQIQPMKMP
jgi:cytochrome c-type biogenesis protein CcmH